ncbi:MAG: putative 4-hydroxybenzoate polyprenyltransferase [Bacteroidetes bacterium]|nr:putative 4-hydroxybenzoate polyprenyltransferase [Bacteroidota bacterium]
MKKYLSFIKIEHTLFSLPMIYSGVFLASKEQPSLSLLVLVLTAAIGARLVAMTLNRIVDREIDKHNPRTLKRELPSGVMNLRQSYGVLVAGLALYLISAKLISDFCFMLSPIPLAVFVVYPYLKRFTPLAHFGVGMGLAMGPLGGFFAVTGSAERLGEALLLPLFNLFWATGFDIIYSTLDEEFDKKAGLYSFPSRFGKGTALKISAFLHVLAFLVLVALVVMSLKALIALPFLLLSGFLLWLEQHKAEDVELAFFKINIVVGFSILVMILVSL